MDVLDVLVRGRLVLDHRAHLVAAALVAAHPGAFGVAFGALGGLLVAQRLLVGDVLDQGLEHEVAAGAFDFVQQVGVADGG